MDSIIVYKDYGEIILDIKTIMDKKGISINQIVKKTGLHHQIVKRYFSFSFIISLKLYLLY